MTETSPNAYLRTKVMTASPAELRLMLFDGAIKFAGQGKEALERADHEAAYNGLIRAQNIVMELINGLRPKQDPELCNRLSSLYTFVYNRLVTAGVQREPALIEEALDVLRFERETWAMLIEQLAQENRQAKSMTDTPDAPAARHPSGAEATSLVGGRVSVSG